MPTALVIGARNLGFAVIERLLSDGWTSHAPPTRSRRSATQALRRSMST
jgi:hypothetical protein